MKMTPKRSIDCPVRPTLAALATATGLLAGCGFDRTIAERTTLGANQPVWTLTPAMIVSEHDTPATATISLTRSNWQPVDFIVPVDGTIHGPLWRWDARAPGETARDKALYPTAETALELTGPIGPQVGEALMAPVVAFGNTLAMPVFVFRSPPGNFMSPSVATLYKRSPRGRAIAGTIPELARSAENEPSSAP